MIVSHSSCSRVPIVSPELLESINSASDAMVVIRESGTILFANQQVGVLLGYAPGELQGQSIEQLMPERFRLPHIGHRLRFTDDRRTRPMGTGRPLFALCKDGSERSVQISLSPVRRGLETLVIAAIREVTELEQVESNRHLAARID